MRLGLTGKSAQRKAARFGFPKGGSFVDVALRRRGAVFFFHTNVHGVSMQRPGERGQTIKSLVSGNVG
jgi:hypothetical protein